MVRLVDLGIISRLSKVLVALDAVQELPEMVIKVLVAVAVATQAVAVAVILILIEAAEVAVVHITAVKIPPLLVIRLVMAT
jgi:hypothetical protein